MAETLDGALMKVPYESLKRTTRERKYLLEEFASALASIPSESTSGQEAVQGLKCVVERLQALQNQLSRIGEEERADFGRLSARSAYLDSLGTPAPGGAVEWNSRRLPQLLVDHLLRVGHHAAAERLAQATGVSRELTDAHWLEPARLVVDALRAHDCGPALAWCSANAARLTRARSPLAYYLRRQQFVELLRAGDVRGALAHGRRYLAPWAGTQLASMQTVAGLLAAPHTPAAKQLLDESQWEVLAQQFRATVYRLNGLSLESPLVMQFQNGLSMLSCPISVPRSRADPLRSDKYARLARGLPRPKISHSQLLCAMSGDILDEHNPPMVLPNGYAYGERALRAQAAAGGGFVTCPITGYRCNFDQLKRAFIS